MDLLHSVFYGLSVALSPGNIFSCFLGVAIGTLIGVLPGLGPVTTITLLMPVTFGLPPETAIIMLAGIFYGAQYGGSTTSILVNIPGESSSVVTCIDGYQMARRGRAGVALGISAIGSFVGGTLSVIGLMCLSPTLSRLALKFGPPEYFALMFLAMVILTFLAKEAMVKSLIIAALGLFMGTIGIDLVSGVQRFTFGSLVMMDGIGLVPVALGLFGVAEVLSNIEQAEFRDVFKQEIKNLLPNLDDWKASIGAMLRGSFIGFFLGILPGGGVIMSSFTSYAVEKRLAKKPEEFGKGAIAGVAGPETANNAATGGAMIPLLSLGIPSNISMALLLGVMLMHGVRPSPFLVTEHPQLFWGVICSMYVGNAMLLVLNLPLVGLWVKLLKTPYSILFPMILLFCLIGGYTVNSNISEVLIMLIFGGLGYIMRKSGFPQAPLVFALIIGPIMESAFRQSLLTSRGNFSIFFTKPISCVLILFGVALLLLSFFKGEKGRRKVVEELDSDI
ncbi:MAG TPA: tripartite tricarboxylate transporter permease [Syntrophorhabdaceae bacterium]|nr:tripartite tricarboxylate transporter permease [Syntrophorhabdaceae bacterium]